MEFVTDRTQADVDLVNRLRAKGWNNMTASEQRLWDQGLKGAYNYTDLNRVESNVAHLSVMLGLTLITKTNWTEWDRPTATEMNRYIGNVWAIREECLRRGGNFRFNPTPDTMNNFNWFYANCIEMDLESAYQVLTEHSSGVLGKAELGKLVLGKEL